MKKRNIIKLSIIFLFVVLITLDHNKGNINRSFIIINDKHNDSMPIITNEIYATITIPKIFLNKELYPVNDIKNNVNKAIEIIFPSKMPDQKNSTLILAAHSGNSKVSFFKDINQLKENDLINIYYKDIEYTYEISNLEQQNKTGVINIINNNNNKTLILTTCDQNDNTKQIVITSYLIKEKPLNKEIIN